MTCQNHFNHTNHDKLLHYPIFTRSPPPHIQGWHWLCYGHNPHAGFRSSHHAPGFGKGLHPVFTTQPQQRRCNLSLPQRTTTGTYKEAWLVALRLFLELHYLPLLLRISNSCQPGISSSVTANASLHINSATAPQLHTAASIFTHTTSPSSPPPPPAALFQLGDIHGWCHRVTTHTDFLFPHT